MTTLKRRSVLAGLLSTPLMGAQIVQAAESSDLPAKWDKEYNVIIVGSGGAGLATAVSAAQHGLKDIVILEKMAYTGGNTAISGGAFNSYDPDRQSKQNIKDSPELHAQQTLKGGDYRANPELVKTLTENSYETVKWLESMGVQFEPKVHQVYGGLYPRAHAAVGALGSDYVKALVAQCKKLDIPILNNCKVVKVYREHPNTGKVLGVEYINKDGQKVTARARIAVVVASGGFGANPTMRALHDPRLLKLTTTNHPGATGDLIPLLQDIGAEVTGMDHIQCNPGCPPGRKQRVVFHLWPADLIMVDRQGKRFVAEDERRDVVRDAILALPDQTAFSIVDADGFSHFNPGHVAMAKKGLETGDAWTADTIPELAKKMGVDPKALEQTIAQFNAGVDAKKDALGKKERNLRKIQKGPFWAGYAGMSVHHTMGGIVINNKTEVLDRYGKVIPHLHAVCEVTGGIHGSNRLGGNAIADIFTYGRLTGIELAKQK